MLNSKGAVAQGRGQQRGAIPLVDSPTLVFSARRENISPDEAIHHTHDTMKIPKCWRSSPFALGSLLGGVPGGAYPDAGFAEGCHPLERGARIAF